MKKRTYTLCTALLTVLAVLLVFPDTAAAVDLEGTVSFWDARTPRTDANGSRLPELDYDTTEPNTPALRATLYLFDQDGACVDFDASCSESDDDYLGWTRTNDVGEYIFEDIGSLQDVYIVHWFTHEMVGVVNTTQASSLDFVLSAVDDDWDGSGTKDFNLTCHGVLGEVLGGCRSQADIILFPQAQELTNLAYMMADARSRIGTNSTGGFHANNTSSMWGYWPDGPSNECSNNPQAAGVAFSISGFCVTQNHAVNAATVYHEIGHVWHFRTAGEQIGAQACQNWGLDVHVPEKCATLEGFAEFTEAALRWERYSSDPEIQSGGVIVNVEGDTSLLNSGSDEPCVSDGIFPKRMVANAARFFWDMYDSTTEDDDGSDNLSTLLWVIGRTWNEFPPGTGNRQIQESDFDGRNIRDYIHHWPYSNNLNPSRDHNCLTAQDNN